MKWALILIILAGSDSSMTKIEGYTTRQACEAAGVIWDARGVWYVYSCVKMP